MRKQSIIMPLMASLLLSACATNDLGDSPKVSNTKQRTIIGSGNGAAPGAVINHKNRGQSDLISKVGGDPVESGVGLYMDKLAKDLQRQLQGVIERGKITIEKRNSDNAMRVSMAASIGFDNLSSVIKPGYIPILNKIAQVLNQYDKTLVTVIGYTDSVGFDADNQRLSERRAKSIVDYFGRQNVNPLRLHSYGKGEAEPRGDNKTEAGRQLNQRVELWIKPVVGE